MPTKKWIACTRKKGYRTESQANKAVFRLHSGKADAYECPYCHMWHLTTRARKADALEMEAAAATGD